MYYFGGLFLLAGYGLYWLFSPPLLRNKRDRQQFITDILVARDATIVKQIQDEAKQYIVPPLTTDDASLQSLAGILVRETPLGRTPVTT